MSGPYQNLGGSGCFSCSEIGNCTRSGALLSIFCVTHLLVDCIPSDVQDDGPDVDNNVCRAFRGIGLMIGREERIICADILE